MKLSIVIVNYNVKYFLEQCLYAILKANTAIETEIIVVDNHSTDDSVPYIQERFPKVKLIVNLSNVGFSKANNQALSIAKGEFILILNPDTVVAEDTLEKCIAFMESTPDAGAIGVKMLDGKGNFLPESKRSLPTPAVAFYKIFGLSTLFPKSKIFGKYHLSFLPKEETCEAPILSGAFMFFKKKVIDEIGYFDETFFMYGEDIDLSYRVLKAGYKNYYYAGTTIVHYKGESTKKGSLNYVRVFYQAMLIFARKHFTSGRASIFSFVIHTAIIFRALLTIVMNLLSSSYLFLVDATLSMVAIYGLIRFWATGVKNAPEYYPIEFIALVVPLYILLWLTTVYLSSGYEKPYRVSPIFRGVAIGTIFIAALYGFLPEEWRFSRAIILLGAGLTAVVMLFTRFLHNLLRHQQLTLEQVDNNRVLAVGTDASLLRVKNIGQQVTPMGELVATVEVHQKKDLQLLCLLYKVNQIVLCSDALSYKDIIYEIEKLGNGYDYKILNEGIDILIGSNSKNSSGDLYATDLHLALYRPLTQHQKRLLDIMVCMIAVPLLPVVAVVVKNFAQYIKNWWGVLIGKKTWVGYWRDTSSTTATLPKIKTGVIHHAMRYPLLTITERDIQQLNYLYAKHYTIAEDIAVILRNIANLGS